MVLHFVLVLLLFLTNYSVGKVFHTLICPFWQGSEQTDWMTSLLLLQISWSFICRPPWSQLPTWMYAYSSSPMSLKFMISYLRVKEPAFTPQHPPFPPQITFPSPARRISVLVEVNGLSGYAGEVCFHEELQQFASVDGTHCLTQTLRHTKRVMDTGSVHTQTHPNTTPCILDRGPPAWRADRTPWSKWHWWRSPSWCPVRTVGAETLSLWRSTCLIAAPHPNLPLCRTSQGRH